MIRQRWAAPAAVTALEGASLLIGLLLQPLLMRALGPATYGAYVLAVAAGSVTTTLVDAGANYTGVQRLLQAGSEASARGRCFWLVQQAKLCAAALVLTLCFSASAMAVGSGALAWTIAEAVCMSVTLGATAAFFMPTWFLYALNRSHNAAAYLLVARAAAIPATLLLVDGPAALAWAVACTSGAPLLAAALALLEPTFRTALRQPQRSPPGELATYLRQAVPTIGLTLLPMLSGMLLPALIGMCGSLQTAGLFGAADKLRTGAVGLGTAFANAAFPMATRLLANGHRAQLKAALQLVAVQPLAAAILAVPLAVWPQRAMQLIGGDAFAGAESTLGVLSVAAVTSTLIGAIGVNLLAAAGAARAHLLATTCGLIALPVLVTLWVPHYGALGAAWAVLAADGVVLVLQLAQLRRMTVKR